METVNLIFKFGLPTIITIIWFAACIDIYVVLPLLINIEEAKIRK